MERQLPKFHTELYGDIHHQDFVLSGWSSTLFKQILSIAPTVRHDVNQRAGGLLQNVDLKNLCVFMSHKL